jgi:predicted transcriptional regulator
MGVTRTDLYPAAELELASLAKALAHPARIAILRCLLQTEHCITGSLTDQIGLAQPTISQHLKELKNMGIIQGTVTGTAVNYCINPQQWQAMRMAFDQLFDQLNPHNTCNNEHC